MLLKHQKFSDFSFFDLAIYDHTITKNDETSLRRFLRRVYIQEVNIFTIEHCMCSEVLYNEPIRKKESISRSSQLRVLIQGSTTSNNSGKSYLICLKNC